MILEGIVTTRNSDRSVNISPMGPRVDPGPLQRFVLRPFRSSTTFANLRRTGEGILHVTDDVEMLALAAIGRLPAPRLSPCDAVDVEFLSDACRWYAFQTKEFSDVGDRIDIPCDVLAEGHLRDFFGWNRAKHAVLEAAILATRLHITPPDVLQSELDRLAVIVNKTAGPSEFRAFEHIISALKERQGTFC